jgi:hypothetical protein
LSSLIKFRITQSPIFFLELDCLANFHSLSKRANDVTKSPPMMAPALVESSSSLALK